jgi:hypothetical protein
MASCVQLREKGSPTMSKAKRTKYEYEVHSWDEDLDYYLDSNFDLEKYLNKKGKDGWQLVTYNIKGDFYHFVFMREKI